MVAARNIGDVDDAHQCTVIAELVQAKAFAHV
jgi:hypothetical protein